MTDDDIKRLKRLAEQATPGPWRVTMKGHSYHEVARVNDLEIEPPNSVELAHSTIDAAYIAAMSPSVTLALLCEIKKLRIDAERYRWLRNEHQLLDPLCRLVWKFDDDRLCSDWVEVVNIDADIDAAIEEQK